MLLFPRDYLFYQGTSPTGDPATLPMGGVNHDFLNQIEVYIIDTVGDYHVFATNVTVDPERVSQIEISNGILEDLADQESNITRYLNNDDYQSALAYISSQTSQLNLPADYVSHCSTCPQTM